MNVRNTATKEYGKKVTVRVQKVKKSHIKQKLVFFTVLAVLQFFQITFVPMILMRRIFPVPFRLQAWHIQWGQIPMAETCYPV